MPLQYAIEALRCEDWPQIHAIYLEGIASGNATFETTAPEWEEWDAAHLPAGRLVARIGEVVAGWAALSAVSSRQVYRGVAEGSLYIAKNFRSQGLGVALARALIEASEEAGIWTLQAMVFPENQPSLRILEKCGFRQIGARQRLARHNGVWRDVLLLERRSERIGVS